MSELDPFVCLLNNVTVGQIDKYQRMCRKQTIPNERCSQIGYLMAKESQTCFFDKMELNAQMKWYSAMTEMLFFEHALLISTHMDLFDYYPLLTDTIFRHFTRILGTLKNSAEEIT